MSKRQSNKSTNNKKAITGSVLLCVVGLTVLGVFTFLGHSYLSGGEIAIDIVLALALVLVAAGLVWGLRKSATAVNELTKWRAVEYVLLAVFVVFALFAGMSLGFGHFFTVNSNKAAVKTSFAQDQANITAMVQNYYDFETKAINKTCDGLENAIGYGSRRSQELNEFMSSCGIQPSRESIKAYRELKTRKLVGRDYKVKIMEDSLNLDKSRRIVNSWAMIELPFQPRAVHATADSIEKQLNTLSADANLPEIVRTGSNYYTLGQRQVASFSSGLVTETGASRSNLAQALAQTGTLTALAWVVMILVNVMILMPYITAPRIRTNRRKKDRDDGGQII